MFSKTSNAETSNERPSYGSVDAELTPLVITNEKQQCEIEQGDGIPVFQDIPYAIVFLLHMLVMILLAFLYGSFNLDEINFDVSTWKDVIDDDAGKAEIDDQQFADFQKFVDETIAWLKLYPPRIFNFIIVPSCVMSYGVSFILTAFLIPACSTAMVILTLLGSTALTCVASYYIVEASDFNTLVIVLAAVIIGFTIYYIKVAWPTIPYAAINLNVALRGISENCGMYLVAFSFSIAGFLWSILWLYVFFGVMGSMDAAYEKVHPKTEYIFNSKYEEQKMNDPIHSVVLFFMLLSLYWTSNILLNTIQITVAGVMATWCFVKQDAKGCCSPGVLSSLYRSLTYSFGSVCMGSLLEAIVTVFRVLLQSVRNQRGQNQCANIFLCILECITRCLEEIIEYFNQWAYAYIGIYGYSYLESGRKVVELFKTRGFTTIVTNNLISHVLGFTNIVVGITTGYLAILVQTEVDKGFAIATNEESYLYGPMKSSSTWMSMGFGFFVGISVSCVMMQVVRGAINTLIVCFADDPNKLEENHPTLTARMKEAWGAAFPDSGLCTRPLISVNV